MKTIVAAVADTHVNDRQSALPLSLLYLLDQKKPALIIHGGDVTKETRVLPQLQEIAPTVAVRGDHDHITSLRPVEYIPINGQTIAIVHGDRPHLKESPSIYANKILARLGVRFRWWNGFFKQISSQFEPVLPDCIVHGHLHSPSIKREGQILIVCPGAVCMSSRVSRSKLLPSIAFLTIGPYAIKAEIVPLISCPAMVFTPPILVPAFSRSYGGITV